MTRFCKTCGKKLKRNEYEDCRLCEDLHTYDYRPQGTIDEFLEGDE